MDEDLSLDQYQLVVLLLTTAIIAVTIAFEVAKDKLEEAISEDLQPIGK